MKAFLSPKAKNQNLQGRQNPWVVEVDGFQCLNRSIADLFFENLSHKPTLVFENIIVEKFQEKTLSNLTTSLDHLSFFIYELMLLLSWQNE